MKILVVPDSFKGSLSARAAAEAMARGARQAHPEADIVLLPLADGGEGTLDALLASDGRRVSRTVTGPLGSPVRAELGFLASAPETAVIESAQAAGLSLIPVERRDPRLTTTYGVGELIRAALDEGASRLLVGLGGSATNDAGCGALSALGARFLDADGEPLAPGGAALARLDRMDLSAFRFPVGAVSVVLASDVVNPLLGPEGASAVYGPQKGATPAVVAALDAALTRFAAVVRRDLGVTDIADRPGGGAAGGLGAALLAFCGATMRSGIDVVLDAANFDALAQDADWVLTGEGRIDAQTLSGKAIFGLLARCRRLGLPVIAFGGTVDGSAADALAAHGLHAAVPITPPGLPLADALRDAARLLEDATARTMETLFPSGSLSR